MHRHLTNWWLQVRKTAVVFIKLPLATARAAYSASVLSVCVSPKCKNTIFSKKTKQFRAMVFIDDLQEVVHGLFKEPIIGPLKSKMAEIRRLKNRHDVIFFC